MSVAALPPRRAVFISCEHASNRIPAALRRLVGRRAQHSHRGWDPGAASLARMLAAALHVTPTLGQVSRLIVDLNRSHGHPRLMAQALRALSLEERQSLVDRYYVPHWRKVACALMRARAQQRCLVHIATHSFVPVLGHRRRDVDIGLLIDPSRPHERTLALTVRCALRAVVPQWRVRLNRPYLGTSDGLPTAIRRSVAGHRYVGMELEVNQALLVQRHWPRLRKQLVQVLAQALSS